MYELTDDTQIKVGTKVQTILGERWGRVVEIDEVEVIDKVIMDAEHYEDMTRLTHMEPRYHVEVGQWETDQISNFKPHLTGDKPIIIRVIRREIVRAF